MAPEIYRYDRGSASYWIVVLSDELCIYLGDYPIGWDQQRDRAGMKRDINLVRQIAGGRASQWQKIA